MEDALAMQELLVNYATGRAEVDNEHFEVRELTDPHALEMAQRLIRLHHYAQRLPSKTHWRWYGLFHDQHPNVGPLNSTQGGLLGLCVFSHTQAARDGLTRALEKALPTDMFAHVREKGGAVELTRLWVADKAPHKAAGILVKEARRLSGAPVVLSYADTDQGHEGRVYHVTNFTYTGLTAATKDPVIGGKEHLHHASVDRGLSVKGLRARYGARLAWKQRTQKHRWLWIADPAIRNAFFASPQNIRWRKQPCEFLRDHPKANPSATPTVVDSPPRMGKQLRRDDLPPANERVTVKPARTANGRPLRARTLATDKTQAEHHRYQQVADKLTAWIEKRFGDNPPWDVARRISRIQRSTAVGAPRGNTTERFVREDDLEGKAAGATANGESEPLGESQP